MASSTSCVCQRLSFIGELLPPLPVGDPSSSGLLTSETCRTKSRTLLLVWVLVLGEKHQEHQLGDEIYLSLCEGKVAKQFTFKQGLESRCGEHTNWSMMIVKCCIPADMLLLGAQRDTINQEKRLVSWSSKWMKSSFDRRGVTHPIFTDWELKFSVLTTFINIASETPSSSHHQRPKLSQDLAF